SPERCTRSPVPQPRSREAGRPALKHKRVPDGAVAGCRSRTQRAAPRAAPHGDHRGARPHRRSPRGAAILAPPRPAGAHPLRRQPGRSRGRRRTQGSRHGLAAVESVIHPSGLHMTGGGTNTPLIESVEKSGFPFQLAVLRELRKLGEIHSWPVVATEVPIGEEFADIVLL